MDTKLPMITAEPAAARPAGMTAIGRTRAVTATHAGGTVAFWPLWPTFGAIVEGVDLAAPVADDLAEMLYRAFVLYGGLLFTGQDLAPADEVAAVALFDSRPENPTLYGAQFRLEGHPEIRVLSNKVDQAGNRVGIVMGKQGPEWHVDGTALPELPVASALYCLESNSVGGDTLFASGAAALDTLEPELKARLEGLVAVYSSDHLQRKLAVYDNRPLELTGLPDTRYPLLATHPETGRRSLFFTGGEMVRIETPDGALTEDERLALVAELSDHLFHAEHLCYRHAWQPGDLLVWDNRSVIHSATFYDYDGHSRLMHHCLGGGRGPARRTAGAAA